MSPASQQLIQTTLDRIAEAYKPGCLAWIRVHRQDLQANLARAEALVEERAKVDDPLLQEALDGLLWSYASALSTFEAR